MTNTKLCILTVELRNLFAPYGRPTATQRPRTSASVVPHREISRRFFVLGSPDELLTPAASVRRIYQDIGLGEKLVTLSN
jgi:hypothetical protein